MNLDRLISDRARGIDASGIRRVFELGAKLKDPINLSIGQPDFHVPDAVKAAAIKAIEENQNGYTLSQGIPALRKRIAQSLNTDLGWPADAGEPASDIGIITTSGTSGALFLIFMAILSPGDEVVLPDPYFVAYPSMVKLFGGTPVYCDTYPDFHMTAARIAPLITSKTKAVLIDSPGNPTGAVISENDCREIAELCREKGVLLISDEIYDQFCFSDAMTPTAAGPRCPSPCRATNASPWSSSLLIRGFGKTYGCTGWRMGYAAGPRPLIEQMTKLQQYSFVCAPSPLQWGCLATFDIDMSPQVAHFQKRRHRVLKRLGEVTQVTTPGGAFYAFVKVPEKLGMTAQQFCERAIEESILIIPGNVFSRRDTHFRLSFAVKDEMLDRGLEKLANMMR